MVDRHVLRILDANLNRAREALRVLEDHARMILDDADMTLRLKEIRHALAGASNAFGPELLLAARDTAGDVGTAMTTLSEQARGTAADVARAAAKRAGEALRAIEEYGKIVSPAAAASIEAARYRLYTVEQSMFLTAPRLGRLRSARLHVLLTESLCRDPWEKVAASALAGGADVIQLREKSLTDRELLLRARQLRMMTGDHGALLIINDRPDIALLSDADGVHIGQDDLSESDARRIVGPVRLIGATVHSEAEARAALSSCGDYFGVGPMFASPTKPDVPVNGPALLKRVRTIVEDAGRVVPLVAIGGVTRQNVGELLSCHPAGQASDDLQGEQVPQHVSLAVAVCQAVIGAADAAGAARELKAAVDRGFSGLCRA